MKPKVLSIPLKFCSLYFSITLIFTISLCFTLGSSNYRNALLGDLIYNCLGISILLFSSSLFIWILDYRTRYFIAKAVPLIALFIFFTMMGIYNSYAVYFDWFDKPVYTSGTLEYVTNTGKTSWQSKVYNLEFKINTSPIIFEDSGSLDYFDLLNASVNHKVQIEYSSRLKRVINIIKYE